MLNGCSDSLTLQDYIEAEACSGILKVSQNTITVIPNPVSNLISLMNLPLNSKISIQNVAGQIVYKFKAGKEIEQIDVSTWSEGVYLVKVASESKEVTQTFVKN